ncbi:sensor histidine kinase [Streptomyces sp. NBC_00158]|uniref:sensor histidine kinase n=1 Tax=Streptomyces sp. NBC_00158 TaxID=2903627 RepID=UPI0032558DEF
MDWGKRDGVGRRRGIDMLVVAGAAALCVTVGFAQTRGLRVYPQLSSLAFTGVPLEGRLPVLVAGFAHYGLVPLAGSALLLWRRRRPVAVAVLLVLLSTVTTLIPAALAALFTVASVRSARTTAAMTALALLPLPLYVALQPSLSAVPLATAVTGGVLVGGAVGWGLFLRALHDRGEQARSQALLRAEQARQRERESLAREMHDVLAHRLSLLSVHAGALEVNPGAPPEQVAQAVGVIRSSAHQAMEDLQQVLGVLRTPLQPEGARPEPPQPTLADLARLMDESRAAGMRIDVGDDITHRAAVPATTGRTAYRIVQEALTNAHKHARGQDVRITLRGAPGRGLDLEVTNTMPTTGHSQPSLPGSGSGLEGLRERAALVGGELAYGREGQTHRVWARLPWPA